MTIVNLRGTHGSGKSTVVRAILDKYPHEPIMDGKRIEGYAVQLPRGSNLYVRGPYHTACGGCDAIQPYSDIWPVLRKRLKYGWGGVLFHHALYEGALVSGGYGSIGEATEEFGDQVIFASLDTPLEVALERIWERRLKKWRDAGKPGDPDPVNPKNTTQKFQAVLRSHVNITEKGRRTVIIDHTNAVKEVLALFGVKAK